MRRFLGSLFSALRTRKAPARPAPEKARPFVENLEDRTLLAVAAPLLVHLPQPATPAAFQVQLDLQDLQTVQVSTDGGATITNLPLLSTPAGVPEQALVLTGPGGVSGPMAVVFVNDFNNDGLPDLAVNFGDALDVLLGQVDGSYQFALSLPQAPGAQPISVTAGDFNADGETDLQIVQNLANGNQQVTLLTGNGDGTFLTQTQTLAPPTLPVNVADLAALMGNTLANPPTAATPVPSPAQATHPTAPPVAASNGPPPQPLPLGGGDPSPRLVAAINPPTDASPNPLPTADLVSRSSSDFTGPLAVVIPTHALDTPESENGANTGSAVVLRHPDITPSLPSTTSPVLRVIPVEPVNKGVAASVAPDPPALPTQNRGSGVVDRGSTQGLRFAVLDPRNSLLLATPLLLERSRSGAPGDLGAVALLEPGPRTSHVPEEMEPPPAQRGRPRSRLFGASASDGRIGLAEVGQLVAQAVFLGSLRRLDAAGTAVPTAGQTPAESQLLVADLIQRSTEAFGKIVKGFFDMFLGRPAEEGEEAGWVGMFLAGKTEEQVLSAFLGTSAFYERTGKLVTTGTPDERFIEGLYSLLLGRSPTETELSGWCAALSGLGRSGVASFVLSSTEYRSRQIAGYFEDQLQRPADPAEIASWAAAPFDLLNIRMLFETGPERVVGR